MNVGWPLLLVTWWTPATLPQTVACCPTWLFASAAVVNRCWAQEQTPQPRTNTSTNSPDARRMKTPRFARWWRDSKTYRVNEYKKPAGVRVEGQMWLHLSLTTRCGVRSLNLRCGIVIGICWRRTWCYPVHTSSRPRFGGLCANRELPVAREDQWQKPSQWLPTSIWLG